MVLEQEHRRTQPLLWGILFSLGLHLAFLISRLPLREHVLPMDSVQEPIEITQIPPEMMERPLEDRSKQVVETEKTKEDAPDPNSKFLSDRNQNVKEQMRAKHTDDFRDKKGTGIEALHKGQVEPSSGEDEGIAQNQDLFVSEGEMKKEQKKGVKRSWKELSLKDLSVGGEGGAEAATDDNLEQIPYGDRTILSTHEFKYFSYYHRMKELLRQYWKPKVQNELFKIMRKGKGIREAERITRLLVLLNDKGEIYKISRLSGSGMPEIDRAAVQAFEQAAPFPNPPEGMLDTDGFVRIRWDFILKTEAMPQIEFQRRPTGRGFGNR